MKIIIILAVTVITVTSISCKKERTCKCTNTATTVITYTGGAGTDTAVSNEATESTTQKETKKDFRKSSVCYNKTINYTNSDPSGTYVTTIESKCELK